MESSEQPTCGRGLATNAALPARLSELLAAQAEVLERHTRALDASARNGRLEIDAYTTLVGAHREVARNLESLAEQMRDYRDLPMAEHDMAVMTDPRVQMEAFRRFVALERELATFLQDRLAEEERLLA